MSYYLIEAEQHLDVSLEKAWDFLSNPANLLKITPADMDFKILSGESAKLFAGQLIHYQVSPVKGVRTRWVTEITQVEEGKYFIDEQRFGPYALWHHQHHLIPVSRGTLVRDVVNYKMPYGWLGKAVHGLTVRKQLKSIFLYREHELKKRFGSLEGYPDQITLKTI